MAENENCLVIVTGQPTAVSNSAIAGIIDGAASGEWAADIFGLARGGLTALAAGNFADLGAQKRKDVEGLRRTPGSVLASVGSAPDAQRAAELIGALRDQSIGTVFVLGDSGIVEWMNFWKEAAAAQAFELRALGVPLSSENEVNAGDHTPGYGSAARFAATVARDAARAAASGAEPIVVLELLGEKCGWLAASSALARDENSSAPHVVCVPERAVDLESLVDETRRAYQKNGYAVVVTGSGAKGNDGSELSGHKMAALLQEKIGVPVRCDHPGSLARVAQWAISRADADETYNLGHLAARLAGDGMTDYLATISRDTTMERGDKGYRTMDGSAQLSQVPAAPRVLADEHLNATGTNVTEAFLDWARPLIGGALPEYTSLS